MARMLGSLAVLFLSLLVAFVTCLGAIRAQPRIPNWKTTLLEAPGCSFESPTPEAAAPCWMGIIVGETTREEAISHLSGHPWVEQVYDVPSLVSWSWNGTQPSFLNAGQRGLLGISSGGVVQQMRILTSIPFGEIWLDMGAPDSALLVRPVSPSNVYQIGFYDQEQLQAISAVNCRSFSLNDYWYSQTTLARGELWPTEYVNGTPVNLFANTHWPSRLRRCQP